MAEKGGREKSPKKMEKEKEGFLRDEVPIDEKSETVSISSLSESQLARRQLRQRWELASVLNFLHVFKSVIEINLDMSAEDIETALINPNNILTQLHISLLKGIPPVNKNLSVSDAWITILCKKLAMWWPWMAEGEIPLSAAASGEEISKYKDLDPTVRLVILKALCELRAHQDDVVNYMNDEVKNGTELSTFRKDRLGEDGKGTVYWYDGDSSLGYRLYKEVTAVDSSSTPSPSRKRKGRFIQPTYNFKWETVATNLEEFVQIANTLTSSNVVAEVSVGKVIENDIYPVLLRLHKKKEMALKRQQKQAMLLNGFLNSHQTGYSRTRRNRGPVCYTFDAYDRSINEAIQLNKKIKSTRQQKEHEDKDNEQEGKKGDSSENMEKDIDDIDDAKFQGGGGSDDSNDHNYDNNINGEDENCSGSDKEDSNDKESDGNSTNSEKENNGHSRQTRLTTRNQKKRALLTNEVVGLRRSKRTATHTNAETRNQVDTKKTLRERPAPNTIQVAAEIVSDSEDEE